MKVLFRFDASETLARRVAALSSPGIEVSCAPEAEDADYLERLPRIDVLWHVLKPVTAAHIERAPRLKLIQKIGSGVNTIDVEAARQRAIAVCNLPGTNSRAVAEMTLLLMLACLRRLPELNALTRARNGWFQAWGLQDHFGELGGRTVGLIGYGAIPRLLEPMLQVFGAEVRYWSRSTRNAELDDIIGTADIVSLHLPLTPETEGILDPRRMKAGAILVNTARGALVKEDALLEALQSGHLAAAGLDVFSREPVDPGHPLLASPAVVCAPHLAWLTRETLERSLAIALANVDRLRRGEPLLHRVA
jgi:phosphoglycerate dehydrogenase-like enzyme